jgi:aspartyl-tRNA(Asn)/glutamyl-tRNA(Gln) amidotransferase subunit A
MTTMDALARELDGGRTSARALVEESLARIADPAGEGARTFIAVDAEGARAHADLIDGLRRRGRAPSHFAGIPFSVKDLFDLAGEETRAGSKQAMPKAQRDAPAIARLKAAGFIALGRTNMTEFAYSGVGLNPHHGTPRSVWDRATGRIPGGSSSGAGVSVADGMCPLAIGTDTGGSCRIPAAYNGIVGWKPSVGRVPTAGAFPLSRTLDAVGPLARSVADCALADALMAEDWNGAVSARPAGSLRLAALAGVATEGLDAAVAAAYGAALSRLSAAGARIADLAMPELAELPAINAKGGISAAEAYTEHRARIEVHGDEYDPRVRNRILLGQAISAEEIISIHRKRAAMVARFAALAQGFDAVALPAVAITPPAIAELSRDEDYLRLNFLSLRNTFLGNFLNVCAISLPMTAPGEAPAGLMLMAPWGSDRALFDVAAGVEAALGR